jgi:hypothetical protein
MKRNCTLRKRVLQLFKPPYGLLSGHIFATPSSLFNVLIKSPISKTASFDAKTHVWPTAGSAQGLTNQRSQLGHIQAKGLFVFIFSTNLGIGRWGPPPAASVPTPDPKGSGGWRPPPRRGPDTPTPIPSPLQCPLGAQKHETCFDWLQVTKGIV